MKIEKMRMRHIGEIARLETLCFSSPWSETALSEQIGNKTAEFFVATDENKVVGYAGMHLVLGEGFVTNIAVFPEHRKKGVAHALIKQLVDLCEISLSLEVRKSNEPAIALYRKLGFELVGERKNFYEKPVENGLIYTLDIQKLKK